MARNDSKQVPGNTGKVKFRVVEFEMEGGNDRIEHGLKAFAQAVMRGNESLQPRHAPGLRTPAPHLLDGSRATEVEEVADSTLEGEEDSLDDSASDSLSAAATQSKPRRRPAPKAPKFLSSLDLTSASVGLDDYLAQKDPKDTQEKYIAITQWFKEFLGTEDVSADHIYTAYKHLGWTSQLPPDPSQPLRDLRYKKSFLDAGSGRGQYKVNWSGTSYVNKMGAAKE